MRRWTLILLVGLSFATAAHHIARADDCDQCKQGCRKGADNCRRQARNPLCKVPGFGGVCNVFKNVHCRAAERICDATRCGLLPGCDPSPAPGGVATGDPHLYTFDQLRYDFQGVGEYLLAGENPPGVEIQARLRRTSDTVSVVSAVAVRLTGHVAVFQPGVGPIIDGEAATLPDSGPLTAGDLAISQVGKKRYLVEAGNHAIWVRDRRILLDVRVVPDPASAGKWEGLFGDFDGKTDDDFRTRDGQVIAREEINRKTLYETFGDSWRLAPGASFLPHGKGENSETVTDRTLPKSVFSVASMDPADFAKAAEVCRAKKVPRGEAMRNCIYDVGATGQPELAGAYIGATWIKAAATLNPTGAIGIRMEAKALQGQTVPIFWSGGDPAKTTLEVTSAAGKRVATHRVHGHPAAIRLPATPGTYSVELDSEGKTATQSIEVGAAMATLTAPNTVAGGTALRVSWTGPGEDGDYIALMKQGATSPRKALATKFANHAEVTFQAPTTAGTYELWYIARGTPGLAVLTRRVVKITAATATLDGPTRAEVGAPIAVDWTGPGGKGDFVGIADRHLKKTSAGISYAWTKDGSPAKFRAPAEPGRYVLRYVAVTSVGRTILATRPIEITDATASLEAPAEVAPGASIAVSWTGPQRKGDYVSLVPRGSTRVREHLVYIWAKGGSGTLKAPAKAGDFDLLYVLQGAGGRRILARRPIRVKAP